MTAVSSSRPRTTLAAALLAGMALTGCGAAVPGTSAPEAPTGAASPSETATSTDPPPIQPPSETETAPSPTSEQPSGANTVTAPTPPLPPAQTDPPTQGGGEGKGSQDDPYPLGEPFEVGDYTVSITDVDQDAEKKVLKANQFNEPPAKNERFVLIGLETTYHGSETGMPWLDLSTSIIGADGTSFATNCGVIPDDLLFVDVQPDDTVTGNICYRADKDQLDGATLAIEDFMDFGGEPVHVKLD